MRQPRLRRAQASMAKATVPCRVIVRPGRATARRAVMLPSRPSCRQTYLHPVETEVHLADPPQASGASGSAHPAGRRLARAADLDHDRAAPRVSHVHLDGPASSVPRAREFPAIPPQLALRLRVTPDVGFSGCGSVNASRRRPSDDKSGLKAPLRQARRGPRLAGRDQAPAEPSDAGRTGDGEATGQRAGPRNTP